ncbi:hypothetical protein C2U70_10895 [Bradyrhizobium guangdongense]|nr:hypothetical protein C2U70_10895 [Bradyrhizobium guangdongense]
MRRAAPPSVVAAVVPTQAARSRRDDARALRQKEPQYGLILVGAGLLTVTVCEGMTMGFLGFGFGRAVSATKPAVGLAPVEGRGAGGSITLCGMTTVSVLGWLPTVL